MPAMPASYHWKRVQAPFRRDDRDGWWIRWNGDGGNRRRRFPTRTAAERARRRIEADLNNWARLPGETPWLDSVAGYSLTTLTFSPKHRREIAGTLKKFAKAAKVQVLGDADAHACETWLAALKTSAASRRKAYAILARFMTWCVDRDYLPNNPLRTIRKPRPVTRVVRAPDTEDWLRLLNQTNTVTLADAQGWYVLILLAVVTGLRESTLLALRWADIEFNATTDGIGLLKSYTTKTQKEKLIGLPSAVCDRLTARFAAMPVGTQHVFTWHNFQRKAFRMLQHAAVFRQKFHSLRASAGTQAALRQAEQAGAEALDHSRPDVFRLHYGDAVAIPLAVAAQIHLPELPPMPAWSDTSPYGRRGRPVKND